MPENTTVGHTPGPWSVFAQPITGPADAVMELIEQVQATHSVVDHIYLIDGGGKCAATTGCGPKSEANARLIAAAPELYEALREMVISLEWWQRNEPGSFGNIEGIRLEAARAALLKASPRAGEGV